RLWDGSVLVTGGNAARSVAERFIALEQVARFRYDGSTAVGEVPVGVTKLSVPRFGHRATRLLDNTVLITGGLTFSDSKLRLVERAEVLNLRAGGADEDWPFNRAPASELQRCQAFSEPAAQSSPITIVSAPEPRTVIERARRTALGPRDVARVRIRLGGAAR
ncbi:MAG: hypothetical protein KC503_35955, partial [Myxococcales bacterium]|nr:hypothetical protein [Myxococcales bacterium]